MNNTFKKNGDFYKSSKFELGLMALIIFMSFSYICWLIYGRVINAYEEKFALIFMNNELVEKLRIDKDRLIEIDNPKILLQIKNGALRVNKINCPNHICMKMGWIKHANQTIVCVPNKMIIEIKSKEKSSVDIISY